MANEQEYRLVGTNHYHDGEHLEYGDTFVPTEREIEIFSTKLEPVESGDDGDGDEGGDGNGDETTDAPFSPGDYTVDELENELSDGDYSDEELDALREQESNDNDRDSAKDAIESQKG